MVLFNLSDQLLNFFDFLICTYSIVVDHLSLVEFKELQEIFQVSSFVIWADFRLSFSPNKFVF